MSQPGFSNTVGIPFLLGGKDVNLLEPLPRRHLRAASNLDEAHRALMFGRLRRWAAP
ncbi:hypothetical protein NTG1052_20029 [Candidatus Nitrotoga sp. 1052]|nr:hypothetical protein NTG1052_20029 [Candidatus Nitrotoga sp. 1052]